MNHQAPARIKPRPGRAIFRLIVLFIVASTFIFAVACGLMACEPDESDREPVDQQREVQQVSAEFDQHLVIPTSTLKFRMRHTDRMVAEAALIKFKGVHSEDGEWEKTYSGLLGRAGDVGDIVVNLPVHGRLWTDLMGNQAADEARATFEGEIILELSDSLGLAVQAELSDILLEGRNRLIPELDSDSLAAAFPGGELYPGERISVKGAGFLRPEEGNTLAVIDAGEVVYADGRARDMAGASLQMEWSGERERADLPVDPAVFGVQIAQFSATFHLENQLKDETVWQDAQPHQINAALARPYLAELSPRAGSRGQKINASGRGLVETDSEAGYGMFFRYEGELIPRDSTLPTQSFRGDERLLRAPDRVVHEQLAEQNIWYEVEEDRSLSGLGATPATFRGSITPVLFDAHGEQVGVGWEGEFEVLSTKQVVYLKFLPSFSTGLDKYGLRNVELEIRKRIIEVAERDYNGINIEFRVEPPDDFVDYTTVELGGPDPSGYQSFGYDNSFNGVAKDTGNLYLADYLGGLNADSGQTYNNPYGGIFLESFSVFSAELNPEVSLASPEFDRIMRPFMPALGGTQVRGTEWPDGPRRQEIAAAIRMVGNVLGNTLTHELGHALGLAFVPEDEVEPTEIFHNIEPGPYIMDPGHERPFEERAELNGQGPAVFNEQNYNYLLKYLPIDQ